MKNDSILHQLKVLDKMLLREFIKCDSSCDKISSLPTPTQMLILEYIFTHSNEVIYQRDLEKILNLRRATVSGVLQTMEKHELIERIVDDVDARSKRIIIKENAKKIFESHSQIFSDVESMIIGGLSIEELEEFVRIINKMKSNLIKYSSERCNGKDKLC